MVLDCYLEMPCEYFGVTCPADDSLLPAGCIHGVLTSKLSALLSANFLHDYALPQRELGCVLEDFPDSTEIETYRMEMALGDPTAQIDFVWYEGVQWDH